MNMKKMLLMFVATVGILSLIGCTENNIENINDNIGTPSNALASRDPGEIMSLEDCLRILQGKVDNELKETLSEEEEQLEIERVTSSIAYSAGVKAIKLYVKNPKELCMNNFYNLAENRYMLDATGEDKRYSIFINISDIKDEDALLSFELSKMETGRGEKVEGIEQLGQYANVSIEDYDITKLDINTLNKVSVYYKIDIGIGTIKIYDIK